MLKKLAILAAVLIAILIVIAITVPYFISDGAFKAPVLAKIEQMTGRKIEVSGRFMLRFFPAAGVTMENVTLSNPASYGDKQPLLAVKSLDIKMSVMSLLHGDVNIKKLAVDEPHFYLHINKDGVKNWLSPPSAPVADKPAAARASSPSAPMVLPNNLTLTDVTIKNGVVTYEDDVAHASWDIAKLNSSLSLDNLKSPLTFDGSGEWKDKTVKVKATLTTPQSFIKMTRTTLTASIDSELMSANLDGALTNAVYSGKAQVKSPSLKTFLAWVGQKAPATPAMMALDMNGNVECSVSSCNVSNANLSLDKISAKGSINTTFSERANQSPQIDANLTTGVLDVNPFLATPPGHSSSLFPDAYAETDGRWSDSPIDFSALQAINGTANIVADGIVVNKVTLGKTTLHAKLENGRLGADLIDVQMYGGKGNITVTIDSAASVPTLEKRASLKGVQMQSLLRDAFGLNRLSGTADIDAAVTTRGKSERALVSALGGNGQFKLTDGALEGVDLTSLAFNKSGGAQKTPISAMSGSFTIASGVISNHDLSMALPNMHIGGQGTVDLPAYRINYRLTPQTMQAGQTGAAAKEGVAVPVVVEGSLENPNFRPDLNALAQSALKNPQAFKDQLKNTRDTLKEQLKSPDGVKNLKNLLQGF